MKHCKDLAVSVFLTGLAVPLMHDWRILALFVLGWALWALVPLAGESAPAVLHQHHHYETTHLREVKR